MCCEHAQNVALPAFAAARRAAIDRDLLPTEPIAANPPHAAAAGGRDRQTDRLTPYRFIDPAPRTMQAVPIIDAKQNMLIPSVQINFTTAQNGCTAVLYRVC